MNKKSFSILAIFLLASMIASPASAGPNIKLSGGADSIEWSLGSLDARGALLLYNTDVIVILEAKGLPNVTCTNQGSNAAPGQNPPNLTATGSQDLPGELETKNGKSPFDVSAVPPATLPGSQGGCPNDNWTAHINFVFWEHAKITVTNLDGIVLLEQLYTCVTKRNPDTVSCTAVQ